MLAAVQLFPGIQAARETIRGVGVSYELASLFSFPPENLLTWLVPGFFGDMVHFEYWGRWHLWEMCLFISFTGFSLAIYTVVFGKGKQRYVLLATVLIMLVLAFVMSFFGFVFAAPGAVWIRGHVTKKKNGIISLAGPVTNIILALIFLSFIFFLMPTGILLIIASYGFQINAFIALFNMLPFMNFDGAKILRWNNIVYAITAVVSGILVILPVG